MSIWGERVGIKDVSDIFFKYLRCRFNLLQNFKAFFHRTKTEIILGHDSQLASFRHSLVRKQICMQTRIIRKIKKNLLTYLCQLSLVLKQISTRTRIIWNLKLAKGLIRKVCLKNPPLVYSGRHWDRCFQPSC